MSRPANVIARAYADTGAENRDCPKCGAQPPKWCTAADGHTKRVPCVARLRPTDESPRTT